jgi:hypothetical protein
LNPINWFDLCFSIANHTTHCGFIIWNCIPIGESCFYRPEGNGNHLQNSQRKRKSQVCWQLLNPWITSELADVYLAKNTDCLVVTLGSETHVF